MNDSEIILLGDPVVHRNGSDDSIGIVTQTGSNFKVLWNEQTEPSIEIESRIRLANLDEIEASQRLVQGDMGSKVKRI